MCSFNYIKFRSSLYYFKVAKTKNTLKVVLIVKKMCSTDSDNLFAKTDILILFSQKITLMLILYKVISHLLVESQSATDVITSSKTYNFLAVFIGF